MIKLYERYHEIVSYVLNNYLCTSNSIWSIRLSVRTRDFHSLKSSSTLLGTTSKIKEENKDGKSQIIIEENPSGQG